MTARDGITLAVDVVLPQAGDRFPVVLTQSRYWRSYLARGQRGGPTSNVPPSTHHPRTEDLITAGFAVVNADTRGTGASEGAWPIMWSDAEADDAHDLVVWIAQQPWCDGRVLGAGLSYEGTTAVLAAACQHPAVHGAVARGFEWDLYDDIAAPGGVLNAGFIREWSESCRDLDRNVAPTLFGLWRYLLKSVRPLDHDPQGAQLAALAAKRSNPDVWESVSALRSADDEYGTSGTSLRQVSLCARPRVRAESCQPLQVWGSWLDGTTSRAVLRMWECVPAVRGAYIGAWSHTGEHGASLGRKSRPNPPLARQVETQVEFLRDCLRDDAVDTPRVLHYFTMREEAWHETTEWPPAGVAPAVYSLTAEGAIVAGDASAPAASRVYSPDAATTTGKRNRWHTQNAKPVSIVGRAGVAGRMLVWRTAPLVAPLVVTGEPAVTFTLTSSYASPAVFAYLEIVDTHGNVHYVTEAIHRALPAAGQPIRLAMRFFPTSVDIPVGWRLQIGLAATDADTLPVPLPPGASWSVAVGGAAPAALWLPVQSGG